MVDILYFGCALFLHFLPQSFLRPFANSIVNCWNKLAEVAEQYVRKGSLVQVTAEWMRQSAWLDQSGTPQASLDIDANRLVLLDRLTEGQFENGDNGHSEDTEDTLF